MRGRRFCVQQKQGIDPTMTEVTMGYSGKMRNIPSGYVKIAIENVPFIVDLPIRNGDFQ